MLFSVLAASLCVFVDGPWNAGDWIVLAAVHCRSLLSGSYNRTFFHLSRSAIVGEKKLHRCVTVNRVGVLQVNDQNMDTMP